MRLFFSIVFLCLMIAKSSAQQVEEPTFFIDGEEVVLQFSKMQWQEGVKDSSSVIYNFKDMQVMDAINAGLYNSWSEDGWKLSKTEFDKYHLKKNLDLFNHEFSNFVKYQINADTWTGPTSEPIVDLNENRQPIKKIKTAKVSENGNTFFKLKGDNNAKSVILSGSFNNWNEQAIKMHKLSNGWGIKMDLPPGIYEYKFIVDNVWTHDTDNPLTVVNQHYTLNSILLVGDHITFNLKGFQNAKKVILAGSFNNWNEKSMKMKKTKDGWAYTLPLPPGKHYYKFIVDGNWHLDPDNMMRQRDKDGIVNSVLLIH
jgi:Glycogen recognition site of AMP-activated protein kinase/Carbohydrate-binding module 48 (Isoamylase N-terminal domain)